MKQSPHYRYPGVKPFSTEERSLFFGREAEIDSLTRYILQQRLVVLYARSGLGKSSLLNAGVIPRLQQTGDYEALSIRLGAWQAGNPADCLALVRAHLPMPEGSCYLDALLPEEDSLWRYFKRYQALAGTKQDLVLVFDQFEELFTYPDASVEAFHTQVAELLNSDIPQRYRQALEAQPHLLDEVGMAWLYQALEVKAVMAIRADRLSQLDRLSGKLPDILDKRYALNALNREQAEEAILNPAYLDQAKYGLLSPPFDFSDEALDFILDHLSQGGKAEIESFQLQVICQYAERQALRRELKQIVPADLGDLGQIFRRHYDDQIAELPREADQRAARILIEEGLIFEEAERRIALYEGSIQKDYGIAPALLRQLVDTHLLRAEPDPRGGFVYELSHDTLVAPVIAAKKRRQAEEEKVRLATEAEAARLRQEAELEQQRLELEEERKKRRRSRWIAMGGVSLALVALIALWFALNQTQKAKVAETAAIQANDSTRLVLQQLQTKQDSLDLALTRAEGERIRAEEQTAIAQDEATKSAIAQRNAEMARAETARRLSELQESNRQRVLDNLTKVEAAINALDFAQAEKSLDEAAALDIETDKVFDGYAELWFYYQEAGKTSKAASLATKAFAAKGNKLPNFSGDSIRGLKAVYAQSVSQQTRQKLTAKYYPVMVEVAGGTFWMGSDSTDQAAGDERPRHEVELSAYAIGRTELTVIQWSLYATANEVEMPEKPGWGYLGDNPVVNVSWDDVQEYLSWLSAQTGDSYRLPTEAEWEYAARGGRKGLGDGFRYSGGNDPDLVAWYGYNSDSRTQAVAGKQANALGLFDMSGNVWEWCGDYYDGNYYQKCFEEDKVLNPKGPENGSIRVLRGGSWVINDSNLRVAYRFRLDPDSRGDYYGFRPARTLP